MISEGCWNYQKGECAKETSRRLYDDALAAGAIRRKLSFGKGRAGTIGMFVSLGVETADGVRDDAVFFIADTLRVCLIGFPHPERW